MAISAAMVKELRTRTGAGMMECKKALTETDGDMETAVELLRKKGTAKADKKADRVAAEGAVMGAVNDQADCAVLVEVNSETDFVAKDQNFLSFVNQVALTILSQQPESVEKLKECELEQGSQTVEDARIDLINKIGENIGIRRFVTHHTSEGGSISSYFHGSRIGVLVETEGGREDLGKDIAMHIAASRPICISRDEVPEQTIAKEKEIFMAQAQDSGKPPEIMEKMVQGRLHKYLSEISLLGQPFVKDPDQTVEKLLKSEKARVIAFHRIEVGEGLEKREDDFVADVMAQAKGA